MTDQARHPIEPLIDAEHAAKLLDVHINWIYKAAADHRIPSYRIGGSRKFRASDLETFIQNSAQGTIATVTPINRERRR